MEHSPRMRKRGKGDQWDAWTLWGVFLSTRVAPWVPTRLREDYGEFCVYTDAPW